MYCIFQVINIHEYLYIGGRVCNTSMCAIQINKISLRPTAYYTLAAPLKLKVGVRLT